MKLRGGRWLSATQVARLCGVDLKTIHNWVNKGKLPSQRTRGRHLRFWPLDIAEFLRRFELGVPEGLRQVRLRVLVVDADAGRLAAAKRALVRRFEVTAVPHAIAGLVALASLAPDVLVAGDVSPLDVGALAKDLGEIEATRHVRVMPCGDPGRLREAIEELLAG
jgi:excisionase family DNA binding protein